MYVSHAGAKSSTRSLFISSQCHLISWLSACSLKSVRSLSSCAQGPLSGGKGRRNNRLPKLARAASCFGSSTSSRQSFEPAPRICIIGGGFAGLYTAVRLRSLMWPQGRQPQVTLIDKGDRFVFKPLLYEIVNGTALMDEVAPSFIKLLSPYNVSFIQGGLKSIEPFKADGPRSSPGRVHLDEGSSVEYDWLVLSLGSESNTMGIPGVKENAYIFNTIQDALQVQQSIDALERRMGSEVVIVGSGPAGVELSATVAERLHRKANVYLVSTGPEILKGLPESHRAAAETVLRRKGVHILRNSLVKEVKKSSRLGVAGTPQRIVKYEEKPSTMRELEADLVLWTAGSQPSNAADPKFKLPFPTTDKGALQTEDTLRVAGHPRAFALGDLASAKGDSQLLANSPATAQVALQQANYAAWNLWASVNNRPLLPFKYQHLGDMMSLGRTEGAVTLPISLPADVTSALQNGPVASLLQIAGIRLGAAEEKGVTLEGTLGQIIRRAAYLYRQPTNEQRLEVGSQWLQKALQASGRTAQGAR